MKLQSYLQKSEIQPSFSEKSLNKSSSTVKNMTMKMS